MRTKPHTVRFDADEFDLICSQQKLQTAQGVVNFLMSEYMKIQQPEKPSVFWTTETGQWVSEQQVKVAERLDKEKSDLMENLLKPPKIENEKVPFTPKESDKLIKMHNALPDFLKPPTKEKKEMPTGLSKTEQMKWMKNNR